MTFVRSEWLTTSSLASSPSTRPRSSGNFARQWTGLWFKAIMLVKINEMRIESFKSYTATETVISWVVLSETLR
jgi:hypothetical protein